MVGAKSGIKIAQMNEAVDEQAGGDQEKERHRYFGDDEQTTNAIAASACSGIATAFLERFVQVEMGRLGGGGESEDQTGANRHQQSEQENFGIDIHRLDLRDGVGNELFQNANAGDRNGQSASP